MSRLSEPAHSRGAGCLFAPRFLLLFSISGIFSDFQHENRVNFIRQCVSINRVCAETYKRCFPIQHRIPCLPAAKLAARCRKPHRLKRISPYPKKRQRTEGRFENMRKTVRNCSSSRISSGSVYLPHSGFSISLCPQL